MHGFGLPAHFSEACIYEGGGEIEKRKRCWAYPVRLHRLADGLLMLAGLVVVHCCLCFLQRAAAAAAAPAVAPPVGAAAGAAARAILWWDDEGEG